MISTRQNAGRTAAEAEHVEALTEAREVFVARQPIFDKKMRAMAYELLYRSGNSNQYDGRDGNSATAQVIVNAFMSIGIEQITGGSPAFINFPEQLLLSEFATVLPKDQVVIEVLETVEPTPEIIGACARLKQAGYQLALDDFVLLTEAYLPLLEFTDIIKVDFMAAEEAELASLPVQLRNYNVKLLAEKVETEEEYELAIEWGYELFQGYFFSRPTMLKGQDIPGFKANYLRIMQQVNSTVVDYSGLENVVKAEMSIAIKLLKYINSAAFGWRNPIGSIQQAIVALGEKEFRKWVSLVCLTSMGEDRPRELLVQSVLRANYCELVAKHLGHRVRSSDYFMVGLLSYLEAIIGKPLEVLLDAIPLNEDVVAALLEGRGLMAEVLESMLAFERNDWNGLAQLTHHMQLSLHDVSTLYQQALEATHELFATGV